MNPAVIDAQATAAATAGRGQPSLAVCHAEVKPGGERLSWWLWPHLLSLDAPLVALVWQRWWARAAGITLPPSRELILGLGVWLIYLADRLADAADGDHRRSGTARHVFSGARRNFLLPLAALIATSLVALTPRWLPGAEFRAGLCLLALALGYFWLVHRSLVGGWAAYLPKEAVVGGMFGAGSVFFTVCRSPHLAGPVWLTTGLFAIVCFLNCALITKWERSARDLRERSSLLNAFPRFTARLRTACLILAATSVLISVATASPLALPVAFSALLLALLDVSENSMPIDGLRVLADIVLLTPMLGLVWAMAAA